MSKGALSNQLLGRYVKRNDTLPHRKQKNYGTDRPAKIFPHVCGRCEVDDLGGRNTSCWPFDQTPNLNGEFIAVIEAAWVEEGSVRVSLRNPMSGEMGDAWLSHLILLEGRENAK